MDISKAFEFIIGLTIALIFGNKKEAITPNTLKAKRGTEKSKSYIVV